MDRLFLLEPDFTDPAAGSAMYYCPSCAAIAGVLGYYPELRSKLHVEEVAFPRPRAPVAALLGPEHPGCPVLVLSEERAAPPGITVQVAATGRRYITGVAEIARYLAQVHGAGYPHP